MQIYVTNKYGTWAFDVRKETPKSYYVNPLEHNPHAPTLKARVPKASVSTTPEKAVLKYRENLASSLRHYERRIAEFQKAAERISRELVAAANFGEGDIREAKVEIQRTGNIRL